MKQDRHALFIFKKKNLIKLLRHIVFLDSQRDLFLHVCNSAQNTPGKIFQDMKYINQFPIIFKVRIFHYWFSFVLLIVLFLGLYFTTR